MELTSNTKLIDYIKSEFPKFRLISEEEIKTSSKEDLGNIFSLYKEIQDFLEKKEFQLSTQIESYTSQMNDIMNDIKQKFGVDNLQDLEIKKQEYIQEILNVSRALEDFLEKN